MQFEVTRENIAGIEKRMELNDEGMLNTANRDYYREL
jgi:hypothetical protein